MEFFCKKTFELTTSELEQIADLFNRVFENNETPDKLLSHYNNNPLGYSYHSMMLDEGRVVGFCAYVPAYYFCEGRKYIFAYSGGYMTDKHYRDFFNFHDLVKNARTYMKKEGVALNFGYPNDNAFPVMIKGKLSMYVGRMHIYCLPYRIGGMKKELKYLNFLSIFLSKFWVSLNLLLAKNRIHEFLIHKEEDSFNKTRYNKLEENYSVTKLKHGTLYYKIQEQKGVRTAFIIDVTPKSPRVFVDAVRYLINKHSKELDMILYPGELPFGFTGMIRLPRKMEPKNFNMTATILDKSSLKEAIICNISNWDTNLSNYDLI